MKLLFSVLIIVGMTNAQAQIGFDTPLNQIDVGYQTTTMLVFPGSIDRTDCGSGDLLVKPDKKDGYVLKIKAAKTDFTPTNLTVFTKDGWMYSLRVGYNDYPPKLLYECGGKDSLIAPRILHDKAMNVIKIQQYSQLISQLPYDGGQYRIKKGGMFMNLQRVFIKDNILFFVFRIANYSNIPYDIQLTRFYTKDRKQRKRSSQMEQEIIPLYQYVPTDQQIKSKEKTSIVVAFDKFTISDHKHFIAEVLERNGDRGLLMRLKGNTLLGAISF